MNILAFAFTLFSVIGMSFSAEIKQKFCVNCRYYLPSPDGLRPEYGICSMFPYENSKFLVDGIIRDTEYFSCSTARSMEKFCGKAGNRYKKKYVTTFKKGCAKIKF
jgi:hypothetical protein